MPRKAGLSLIIAALLLGGCSQANVPAPPPLPKADESQATLLSAPAPTRWVWSALEFADEQNGWAALATPGPDGTSALYRTQDGGNRWTRTGAPAFLIEAVRFTDERQGVAMGASFSCRAKGRECAILLATTDDGGATWETRYRHPLAEGLSSNSPTVAVDRAGTGYALYAGSNASLLLTTADGGMTWARAGAPASGWEFQSATFLDGTRGWTHARNCAVQGGQERCRYAVFATSSGGKSWQRQFELPEGRRIRAGSITFVDAQHGWVSPTARVAECTNTACAGPVYRTADGGRTWVPAESPGLPLQVSFTDPARGWMLLSSAIGTTTDGGATWERHLPAGLRELQLLSAPTALAAWAVGSGPDQPGALVRTTDGGKTWTLVSAPPVE
ncbi:MAG TPA: hypothetical protein VNT75_01485 [Symbiobacteriaceae bacterium]|nr:hypothetical protein [Symbiobacteriaceae bacterium]